MRNLEKIKSVVYLKDFIIAHKKRLKMIKEIDKKYHDRKIIFQLSILGIESLAKYYKPKIHKKDSNRGTKKRFILLLSKSMKRKEAEEFYTLFRNSYIHVGFPNPFLDWEDEDNLNLGGIYEKDVSRIFPGANIDYPKETIISIYEELIYFIESYFKKKGVKYRIFKDIEVINIQNWKRTHYKDLTKK